MKCSRLLRLTAVLALGSSAFAATYEVGPGKTYATIGQAPWLTLQAGDTVLIYWNSQPYHEKWAICRQGTASAPITVRGVAGPNGELPVIDGDGAVAPTNLVYWSENRGVIKVGGCSKPADVIPTYINIENLDVRGARDNHNFTGTDGSLRWYDGNAASIHIEKGSNIAVRNSIIRDSGNGIFISSGDQALSRDILIEGNYIHDNGNVSSGGEHNVYAQALGITYQYNRFGPLTPGSGGENLKDRSAGTVVRYNWIEGGNHELDLVDATNDPIILSSPQYSRTYVYGNILIEPAGDDNRAIVHYGGDSGVTSSYRKGTLFFYDNTVSSTRTDRTTMFRPATNDESIDARNNVFYASAGGNMLSVAERSGRIALSHNCAQPGWTPSYATFEGSVTDDGSMVTTSTVFSGSDYRLASGSPCATAGGPVASGVPGIGKQYRLHQASQDRTSTASIGALDSAGGTTILAPVILAPVAAPSFPIRVNAGGSAFTDASGVSWQADTGFSSSKTYSNFGNFVAGTTVQALYQTERYNPGGFTYQFPVPNGTRAVRLRFAEIWFSQAGQRVFNVAINGQQVLSNFDIAATAGPRVAIDRTFQVNVTGGQVRIDFLPVVENPKVSAIEIE